MTRSPIELFWTAKKYEQEDASVHCGCRFIQSKQTKVKQYQVKWPPEDLTLVENPTIEALFLQNNKNFNLKVNSIADKNTKLEQNRLK